MAPVGGALSSKADDRSPAGADWVDAMEAWWTEEPGGDWSRHRDGKHHLAKGEGRVFESVLRSGIAGQSLYPQARDSIRAACGCTHQNRFWTARRGVHRVLFVPIQPNCAGAPRMWLDSQFKPEPREKSTGRTGSTMNTTPSTCCHPTLHKAEPLVLRRCLCQCVEAPLRTRVVASGVD
jgi:hypothetical protein